jgi:hypothetical protein
MDWPLLAVDMGLSGDEGLVSGISLLEMANCVGDRLWLIPGVSFEDPGGVDA